MKRTCTRENFYSLTLVTDIQGHALNHAEPINNQIDSFDKAIILRYYQLQETRSLKNSKRLNGTKWCGATWLHGSMSLVKTLSLWEGPIVFLDNVGWAYLEQAIHLQRGKMGKNIWQN